MAIIQALTVSFKQQLLEGVHDFRTGGDTFKIALYTNAANLNSSTTAYTTTGEVVGDGYTAGGATLTNITPASGGIVAYASFLPVTWNGDITARGAMIYNTTPAHTYSNPSVMVIDFGIDRVAPSEVFTITFPTADQTSAIIRVR